MKGNAKLLKSLNGLLSDELTAINQYMVHAEMCSAWGYTKLHDNIQSRAITEMKHAEKLIERILFLEGTPIVSSLNDIHIADDVTKMMINDLAKEMGAVKSYNEAIKLASEVGDNATGEILKGILRDEDAHVDDIEEQTDEIGQMGIGIYLSTKK
jgi:bacterioferritin